MVHPAFTRFLVVGQFEPYEGGWGRGFASPQNSQRLGMSLRSLRV
jgi:hypothetical protein